MGFNELSGGIANISKGTFSIWFNVPAASITAARLEWAEASDPKPQLCGIVPIMVFGERDIPAKHVTSGVVGSVAFDVITWHWLEDPTCDWAVLGTASGGGDISAVNGTTASGYDIDPSFIGIDCRTDRNVLVFAFQYPDGTLATVTGGVLQVVDQDRADYDLYMPIAGGGGDCVNVPSPLGGAGQPPPTVGGLYEIENILGDVSSHWYGRKPEMFGTVNSGGTIGTDPDYSGDDDYHDAGPTVTADAWHHVLLSWDFTQDVQSAGVLDGSTAAYHETAQIYLSYDDVNKTGRDLGFYMSGDNTIVTPSAWEIYHTENDSTSLDIFVPNNSQGHSVQTTYTGWVLPEYSFTPPTLASDEIEFPGGPDWTKRIRLAECQFYADRLTDTSVEANRRAFVTSTVRPVSHSAAITLMGKDPEIRLQTLADWQSGNQGTAGAFTPYPFEFD
jgi:hypothetical protein